MSGSGPAVFIHATAVIVGPFGLLIEGPSGSGKSSLARALLAEAQASGRCGLLVGDDRIALSIAAGRLVARPHPRLAGLLEQRGVGLVRVEHEPACVLHGAVSLRAPGDPLPPRLPDQPPVVEHLGVRLPRLDVPPGSGPFEAARAILAELPRRSAAVLKGSNLLANSAAMHNIPPHDEAEDTLRTPCDR